MSIKSYSDSCKIIPCSESISDSSQYGSYSQATTYEPSRKNSTESIVCRVKMVKKGASDTVKKIIVSSSSSGKRQDTRMLNKRMSSWGTK